MDSRYSEIRFKLFTQSYSGRFLVDYLYESKYPPSVVKKIARVLLFKEFMICRFIQGDKYKEQLYRFKLSDGNKVTAEKISIYLKIEHELYLLMKLKQNKVKFEEYEYEQGNTFLSLAIERVAGGTLNTIENDYEFEDKLLTTIKYFHRSYYQVAYVYKLPTIRILPFILRLIK